MKRHLLILTIFALGLGSVLRAESTKEFYSDAGLDFNNGPMNVIVFSQNSDGNLTEPNSPANVPDGIKYFHMTAHAGWGGFGVFNVTAPGGFTLADRDFSDYFPPNTGNFRFWVKSNNALTVEIQGDPNTGFSPKYGQDIASTGGQWQEFQFPFSIGGGGIDIHNVQSPFIIRKRDADAGLTISWDVDHVRWTRGVDHLAIFPPTLTVNPGQHRQVTIEGRASPGANSEISDVYATFAAPATLGTMATDNGLNKSHSAIITANSTSGNITANDGFDGKSVTSNVTVTNANLDAQFGLLSESIPGVNLDVDSRLGTHTQPSTINVGDSFDSVEGNKSFVSTVTLLANDFAGWYINWGLDSNDNSTVMDMSNYYDGSIQFWFKGTNSINGKLKVGIRSGNVPAGTELSALFLDATYAVDGAANIFDGLWHPIVLPLAPFAKSTPWADLSRIKVFFSAYVISGASSINGTFYIDNLRWNTRKPHKPAFIGVAPNPTVLVPLNSKRLFTAYGLDVNGIPVDVLPVWTTTGGIGSLSRNIGITSLLSAAGSNANGTVAIAAQGLSSSTIVNVAPVNYTQSYNVYSDAGSGGFVGVSKGGAAATNMTLNELAPGVATDPATYRQATMTLLNTPGNQDAFAVWFTDEQNGSRYMRFYNNGYLDFWVRTTVDLQFSLRSANIAAGTELCKFRLSELGIPLDGNFQEVLISLADFKTKDPRLDFDQIQTYFVIGGIASQIGEVSNVTFDIDNVKWLTSNPDVPSEDKVYQGLKEKQNASGLVRSFETLAPAVTYDQALAAMNYTYHKDTALAKKVFDVYLAKYNAGGFAGFHDTYDVATPSTILDNDRMAGPNAWMLLALIHYRNVSGDVGYDAMITGIATWLKGLQAGDGGVQIGFINNVAQTAKSTEHNFDCYAAFQAYAKMKTDPTYDAAANAARSWLDVTVYNPAQKRFNIGTKANGALDTDKALDAYSWAPLALSSYSVVLNTAETDLRNTKPCDLTGVSVDGFDMGGTVGNAASYTDAVWLEGTAQMAVAYLSTGNFSSAYHFMNELDKSIVPISGSGAQGMAYATNGGTGYGGFMMDSQHQAISSMAWYLFAKRNFNPFHPYPLYSVQPKTIGTNVAVSSITWTVNIPNTWVRANQFIQLQAQPVSTDPYGIQIYTDNANPTHSPHFLDPSPLNSINVDSDPSGLLNSSGTTTTTERLPLAWRILDSTSSLVPSAIRPYTLLFGAQGPESFSWFYFKDRGTPAIDADGNGSTSGAVDGTAFSDGEDYITLRNSNGLHNAQGLAGYFPGSNLNAVFLEGDFTGAAAQMKYETQITVEFYMQ